MAIKYLDYTGLSYFWSKVKQYIDTHSGGMSVLDCYPIGSYYETSDTTFDPNTAWGGTWEKDSAGKVTVAQDTSDADFDTVGESHGSKTSATEDYALTASQIPAHSHGMSHTHSHSHNFTNNRKVPGLVNTDAWSSAKVTRGSTTDYKYLNTGGASNTVYQVTSTDTDATASSKSSTDNNTGGGGAHNHGNVSTLQPYVVVNRWHRTA